MDDSLPLVKVEWTVWYDVFKVAELSISAYAGAGAWPCPPHQQPPSCGPL